MEHLDKLLKESFDGFTPDAPDVWHQVSQQVATQAGKTAVKAASEGKTAVAVKSTSVFVKLALIVGIPAAAIIGIVYYQQTTEPVPALATERTNIQPQPDNQSVTAEKEVAVPTSEPQHAPTNQPTRMPVKDITASVPVDAAPTQPEQQTAPVINIQENHVQPTKQAANEVVKPTQTQNNQPSARTKVHDRSERATSGNYRDVPATINETMEDIDIANVFTPDGNGKNDEFGMLDERIRSYHLKVLDEDGNLVFESSADHLSWDGKHFQSGAPCDRGVYSYSISYELKTGATGKKLGKVELIR